VFRELLDNPSARHPRELQSDSAKVFSDAVASSKLRMISQPCPIRDDAFIVIGVASYSILDLDLLDGLNRSFDLWHADYNVYVFDVLRCKSRLELDHFLRDIAPGWFSDHAAPELVSLQQTPIVLIFKRDHAVTVSQGVGPTRRMLEDLHLL